MKLEDINKENCFKVPENYFDNFNSAIHRKIYKSKSWKTLLYPAISGLAAAMILGYFLFFTTSNNNKETIITEYLLEESFYSESIALEESAEEVNNDTINMEKQEIVNYLAGEDISMDDLIDNI